MTLARECRNCLHWAGKPDAPIHECRRYAPQPAFAAAGALPLWPLTMADHWCGEFDEMEEPDPPAAASAPVVLRFVAPPVQHRGEIAPA